MTSEVHSLGGDRRGCYVGNTLTTSLLDFGGCLFGFIASKANFLVGRLAARNHFFEKLNDFIVCRVGEVWPVATRCHPKRETAIAWMKDTG